MSKIKSEEFPDIFPKQTKPSAGYQVAIRMGWNHDKTRIVNGKKYFRIDSPEDIPSFHPAFGFTFMKFDSPEEAEAWSDEEIRKLVSGETLVEWFPRPRDD